MYWGVEIHVPRQTIISSATEVDLEFATSFILHYFQHQTNPVYSVQCQTQRFSRPPATAPWPYPFCTRSVSTA